MGRTAFAALAAFTFLPVVPAGATLDRPEPVLGRALVIDGDTIKVEARLIDLYGIDAPELNQTCIRSRKEWPCGREAASALRNRLGPKPVLCDVFYGGDSFAGNDIHLDAVCQAGGEDLSEWLVRQGWALALEDSYRPAQAEARKARRGIWAGDFLLPREWRERRGS